MVAPTIFQVEDDEDFSFLMEHAIKEINSNITLTIAPNGNDGIGLLNKYQENAGKPGLILLDLNLPGMSGLDILKIIRERAYFERTPVVFFYFRQSERCENSIRIRGERVPDKAVGIPGTCE
jgi:DNA-binding response OmpR family regulator